MKKIVKKAIKKVKKGRYFNIIKYAYVNKTNRNSVYSISTRRKTLKKYKFKMPPYEHQLIALRKGWNLDEFAYFMDMGTGKSKVLLDNVAMLFDKGLKCERCLALILA